MKNRNGRRWAAPYAAIAALLLLASPISTDAEAAPLAQWLQYGANGGLEARAVTDAPGCPAIAIDGQATPMVERAAPAPGFDVRLCTAPLPTGTGAAAIEGVALPLPRAAPRRILVVGDTGCRVKLMIVPLIQPCNDPAAWPWPQLAATAAALKPDLVLHVGDYYYREDTCPAGIAGCAGSPAGDKWPTWRADFFTPAAPLLTSAPWIFVRGNHEDCHRGGVGWTRLLDPGAYDPATPCIAHDPLYVVKLGGLSLAILDSSYAPDPTVDPRLLPIYQPEFASLAKLDAPVWLVTHRPLFGVVRELDSGRALGGNATLVAALGGDLAPSVELLLAGHIHILEVMNFAGPTPPQLVAGFSGDMLDKEAPASLDGLKTGGRTIAQGFSLGGFGFVLLERGSAGWEAAIHDAAGKLLRRCRLADHRLDCVQG
jgi:hypothetical protein